LELAHGAVANTHTHTHKQPPPFANPISRESSPLESACFDFSPLPRPPPAAAAVEFELDFQASPTEISSLQALEEEEEEEERKNERRRSSDLWWSSSSSSSPVCVCIGPVLLFCFIAFGEQIQILDLCNEQLRRGGLHCFREEELLRDCIVLSIISLSREEEEEEEEEEAAQQQEETRRKRKKKKRRRTKKEVH
jgi:hypothetical protein